MLFRLQQFWRRVKFYTERERFQRELEEELATHRDLRLEEHIRAGFGPEHARARASREMGSVLLAREQSTDIRGFISLDQLMQDIRYAFRLFVKHPAFSLVAVLSLALGIAGSTAVFSMVNAILLKPLPFADPERLVRMTEFYPRALYVHFRERLRTMDLAQVTPGAEMNVSHAGPAFRISVSTASVNLFSLLGVPTRIGAGFQPDQEKPGLDKVVVLSDGLWRSKFDSDPAIIGKVISVNGASRQVIGVMPPSFAFPSSRVEAWIPLVMDPGKFDEYWGGAFVPLIGRLRPGVTIEQAKAEVHSHATTIWKLFPYPMVKGFNSSASVVSLQSDLAGDTSGKLLMLLCAVGAVLVIAAANVASLLLARAASRQKEIAMRASLGAGRMRIVRQLLTESILLAGGAGVVGIVLGSFALTMFRVVLPPDLFLADRVEIDWRVAGFAAALSLLTGISFGLVPAINAARMNLVDGVRTGGRMGVTRKSLRFRSWLLAGEIGLTLVLTIGAALLIRTLHSLAMVDPGFNARQVLTLKISPLDSFCTNAAKCVSFYDEIMRDARGLSGVTDAAIVNTVPLDAFTPALPIDIEGRPKTADNPAPMFWSAAISSGYLRLMEIPIIDGRPFTEQDSESSEPVVLVTASTAKRYWPNESAIGKHLKVVWENKWRRIVGVVADVRQYNLADRAPTWIEGAYYTPYSQAKNMDRVTPAVMNLIVKTATRAPQVSDNLYQFARARNSDIPVSHVVPLERAVDESISNVRSITWILLSFAGVALILATIGIYGLVSYSVSQRKYEISLRMAVGATNGSIVRMVLGQSLKVAGAGLAAGLTAAAFLTKALTALLFGVEATDVTVFGAVSLFLLMIAIAASLLPAWKASRIDPIRSLRAE